MTSEKHPITETRLKTWVLLGHSNADGWAGTSPMFEALPHLLPTANPETNPADAYWKNCYVFTSDIPWSLAEQTPVLSDIGNGEWLELTVSNPEYTTDPHPFPSPYLYPNNRGSCYPNWMHNASPHGGGTHCGVELPFSWHWAHHWQEQTGMIKLALSSTLLLRAERGGSTTPATAALWFDSAGYSSLSSPNRPPTTVNPAEGFFGWWKPYDNFDWAPNSDRIYRLWFDKMEGAQAALPTGSKMDVRLVVAWFGDNDSNVRQRETLETTFEKGVREMIRRIRQDLVDNDWTTLPADEVVIVWPGIHPSYDLLGIGNPDFCNEILQRIAADDPFFKYVSSAGWLTLADDGIAFPIPEPSTHVGVEGYGVAAQDIYDAFAETQVEPYDALDAEQRVTVQTAMDEVRTYYTRARVNTDVDDETLLQHINGALFHILNKIGDQSWFLRRRKELALDAGPNTPFTMPRYVHRLLKIEDPNDVLRSVDFEQTGFTEGGKLEILMRQRAAGDFNCHFITQPKKMTRIYQLIPLPFQMIEWLVAETCLRLSRASGNAALQTSLEIEVVKLHADCMRNMGVMQRSKNDRLQKQRQLPNARNPRRPNWP